MSKADNHGNESVEGSRTAIDIETADTESIHSQSSKSLETEGGELASDKHDEKTATPSEIVPAKENEEQLNNWQQLQPRLETGDLKAPEGKGKTEENNNIDNGKAEEGKTSYEQAEPANAIEFLKRYSYQLKLMACLSLFYLSTGPVVTYPSIVIADLEDNNTTVYGTPISFTESELDSVGSFNNIGSMLGLVMTGFLLGTVGRRITMGILSVLGFVGWIGLALSPNPTVFLVFRIVSGMTFGGAGSTRITYIVEMSDNYSRPVFTQLGAMLVTTGQVLSIVPSFWLRYYGVAFFNSAYPALFLLLLIFIIPESPTYLTVKGKDKEAAKVLRKLRGENVNLEPILQNYRDVNREAQQVNKLKAICNKTVIKRIALLFVLYILKAFSGMQTFQSQAVRILLDSGSDIDSTLASLICQFSMLAGVITLMPFVKRLGRRGCLMLSFLIAGIGLAATGTFTLFFQRLEDSSSPLNSTVSPNATNTREFVNLSVEDLLLMSSRWLRQSVTGDRDGLDGEDLSFIERNAWIPLVCIMFTEFGFGMGLLNMPLNLASEYFPTVIRPQTSAISVIFHELLGFINLQLYSTMQAGLTLAGMLYLYTAVCCLGIPFVFFCVIETVGKDLG